MFLAFLSPQDPSQLFTTDGTQAQHVWLLCLPAQLQPWPPGLPRVTRPHTNKGHQDTSESKHSESSGPRAGGLRTSWQVTGHTPNARRQRGGVHEEQELWPAAQGGPWWYPSRFITEPGGARRCMSYNRMRERMPGLTRNLSPAHGHSSH